MIANGAKIKNDKTVNNNTSHLIFFINSVNYILLI